MSGLIQASFKRTFKQKRLCLSYCENHPNRRLLEEPPSLAQVAKSLMRTVPHLLCNITACPRHALETSLHSLKTPPSLPSPSRPSGALIVVGSKQMKAPSCYTGLLYRVSSVPHPNDDVTHCVGPTKWVPSLANHSYHSINRMGLQRVSSKPFGPHVSIWGKCELRKSFSRLSKPWRKKMSTAQDWDQSSSACKFYILSSKNWNHMMLTSHLYLWTS